MVHAPTVYGLLEYGIDVATWCADANRLRKSSTSRCSRVRSRDPNVIAKVERSRQFLDRGRKNGRSTASIPAMAIHASLPYLKT